MTRLWILMVWVAVWVGPAWAQDEAQDEAASGEPVTQVQTLLGDWYVQHMEGEFLPPEMTMRVTFGEDGVLALSVEVEAGGELPAGMQEGVELLYQLDGEGGGTLTFTEGEQTESRPALFLINGPVLYMQAGSDGVEMTRDIQGTPAIWVERQAAPDPRARAIQSVRVNMARQLLVSAIVHAIDNDDTMPESLRALLATVPELWESPLFDAPMPDGLEGQARLDWVVEHCVFVYLPARTDAADATSQIVLFQKLAEDGATQELIAGYLDGHTELLSARTLDEHLLAQTGRTLADWSDVNASEAAAE